MNDPRIAITVPCGPGEAFHLSREERDYVAGHALDTIWGEGEDLANAILQDRDPSTNARRIASLSNLLGDIGWEREIATYEAGVIAPGEAASWHLGRLFPTAQLRPWLEEWCEEDFYGAVVAESPILDGEGGDLATAQAKLSTGGLLLARLEKWMASHGN